MRRTDPHVPLSDWVLTVGYSAVSPGSLTRTALRYDASEAGLYFEAINNCHEAPCVGLRIVLNG